MAEAERSLHEAIGLLSPRRRLVYQTDFLEMKNGKPVVRWKDKWNF
jgi:hypothetical protein